MKFLALALSLFPIFASAAQYTCLNQAAEKAELTIQKESVQWNDVENHASSKGIYLGVETAPYSAQLGQHLFKLESFFSTDDAYYVLALDTLKGPRVYVTSYFDNDDNQEEVSIYVCSLNTGV